MTSPFSRRHALAAGGLGLLALTAACASEEEGSEDATSDGGGTEEALVPPAEGGTTYPLDLTSPFGSTTLEARPTRIAVVSGIQDLEAVLALGAFPVITDEVSYPWQEAVIGEREIEQFDVWSDAGLPLEQILAASPDVIVATTYGNLAEDYEELAAIAPVVTMESYEDQESWEYDWRDVTRRVGLALDLQEAAEQVVADTEGLSEQAAAEHPDWQDRSLSFVLNRGQEVGLAVSNYAGSVVEETVMEWGFAAQPHAEELASTQGDVSLENLDLIDAELLVIAQHGGNGTAEEAQAWLEGNELYQGLPAVQEGRVAIIQPDASGGLPIAWGFNYPNALSTPWVLDQFAEAVEPVLG